MRTISELKAIEDFTNSAYSRYGNSLHVNLEKPYNPENPELGYSYRYRTEENGRQITVYNVVCAKTGIQRTDYRVMMHEYGHIYLAHLDGIYEEFDTRICNVFRDYRGELIEKINSECGIDFADKLIERVIDDPVLNHSIHNIAMDMEVNSKVLSKEDVEEMEMDISTTLPKTGEEALKQIADSTDDPELKKKIEDRLKKMENEAKIKLIVPERYHTKDGKPFPPELSYAEYLIMIIKNLDQFIKMMVNINQGGNGDTSNVSSDDVKKALGGGDGQNGMNSLDELMRQMGMADDSGDQQGQGASQGGDQDGSGTSIGDIGSHDTSNTGGRKGSNNSKDSSNKGTRGGKNGSGTSLKDHRSELRDEADQKRSLGQITAGGGAGCGNDGGPDATRLVEKTSDTVDEAIDEVLHNFKNKVIQRKMTKDVMWNYNKGINRKVICPSIRHKVTMTTEPKIVYLIDISGSMDTNLVDRVLNTIARKMKKIGRGLHYDIISWSTYLGEHLKDIDPKKGVPRISCGGGTRMAEGMRYFKANYDESAILILISDFEDYLDEWHEVELTMPKYTMYGFNYGRGNYNQDFKYFKVKNFNNSMYDY